MINPVENSRSTARSGQPDPEVQAGRALRRLRMARNWSQEEVAKRMKTYGYDFHQTTVAKLEAAQRPLRVRELADFAALYGVEVQELIYPPSGSLKETEQEIAETTAMLAIARAEMDAARAHRNSAHAAMFEADRAYEASASSAAMLDGRLAALLNERNKLIGWDTTAEAGSEGSAASH